MRRGQTTPAPPSRPSPWGSVDDVLAALSDQDYVAERGLATAVFLAAKLQKPLLVEGEPGCGKTELAKVLASATRAEFLRLQCYEGLDANASLYEWNYSKQLMTIRLNEKTKSARELEPEIFSERFLMPRPLLRALQGDGGAPPVLLIDEIDRADEEFEGLLLEVLSDFQITIPELGTIRAKKIPFVVITSNRTRELSDALKRRCLYAYVGYPSLDKEVAILRKKVPGLGQAFARDIAAFVQRVRSEEDLVKRPGVSETLNWAAALLALEQTQISREVVEETLGVLVKEAQDLQFLQGPRLDDLVAKG
ncbi:MAG TPA: MoxR family ATPase [Thermoplasmata archaeon]|nr:MoxR family ATPase [Thermoplasmata archaeon]